MKRIGLFIALGIIVISNVIALVGVSLNRFSGSPRTMELTERELPMQPRDKEDSNIRLRLAWRRSPSQFFPRQEVDNFPFDRDKLRELGFDCSAATTKDSTYRQPLPREVYVALEYAGAAWEQWLKKLPDEPAKTAQASAATGYGGPVRAFESMDGTNQEGTRLFVVDAAADHESLYSKYPDQSRYLIVRAVVTAVLSGGEDSRSGTARPYRWGGYVSQALPPEIHVPLPMARELAGLTAQSGGSPRYQVKLHYGSNLEPWVESVQLGPK